MGGEDPSLLVGVSGAIPGQEGILYGNGSATSLYVAPSETIEAWDEFLATVNSNAGESTTVSVSASESMSSTSERETVTGSVTTFAASETSSASA